jgi:hypothetical protein
MNIYSTYICLRDAFVTDWAVFVTDWGHIRDRLVTNTSKISRFNAINCGSKSLIEYLYRYSNRGRIFRCDSNPLPFAAEKWGVDFV